MSKVGEENGTSCTDMFNPTFKQQFQVADDIKRRLTETFFADRT